MEKFRYYIDTEGNDDEAYREAMQYACKLSNENPSIKRIVMLAYTKQNTGWLDRIYGDQQVKKMFSGVRFNDCSALFIIKTMKTYSQYDGENDIVISMGLDSAELMKVDDYYRVTGIIAIPWLKTGLQPWIDTWAPTDIRSGNRPGVTALPDPIVRIAMDELSRSVNMTTGIHHPNDNHKAKSYIRALHKYKSLDGEQVSAYLIREKHWDTDHALDVKKLIDTLNSGKHFQGGDKTGLKSYITYWESILKENNS